mmetsp:Transcript_6036/g.9429  ORF Transcript_6036/g.9429 Transcript_6036/m.9429 type:complete len:477 (-) Transcript_6036:64-1494(-)
MCSFLEELAFYDSVFRAETQNSVGGDNFNANLLLGVLFKPVVAVNLILDIFGLRGYETSFLHNLVSILDMCVLVAIFWRFQVVLQPVKTVVISQNFTSVDSVEKAKVLALGESIILELSLYVCGCIFLVLNPFFRHFLRNTVEPKDLLVDFDSRTETPKILKGDGIDKILDYRTDTSKLLKGDEIDKALETIEKIVPVINTAKYAKPCDQERGAQCDSKLTINKRNRIDPYENRDTVTRKPRENVAKEIVVDQLAEAVANMQSREHTSIGGEPEEMCLHLAPTSIGGEVPSTIDDSVETEESTDSEKVLEPGNDVVDEQDQGYTTLPSGPDENMKTETELDLDLAKPLCEGSMVSENFKLLEPVSDEVDEQKLESTTSPGDQAENIKTETELVETNAPTEPKSLLLGSPLRASCGPRKSSQTRETIPRADQSKTRGEGATGGSPWQGQSENDLLVGAGICATGVILSYGILRRLVR